MKKLIAIFVCVLIAGCDINPPEKMPSSPTSKPLEIPWNYDTLKLLDGRVFRITSSSRRGKVDLLLYKRGLGRSGLPDIIGTYNSVDEAKEAFRVLYKLEKAME